MCVTSSVNAEYDLEAFHVLQANVGSFSSNHFFLLWLKAFHFQLQSRLLIKSVVFTYDNPIHADTVYSHVEHRKH